MGVVADEEAEAIHRVPLEGVLAREEKVPAPELRTEHRVDPLGVRLEGPRDPLVSLTEADAERAECEATLGPRGSGLGEAREHLLLDAPALFVVGAPQGGELHFEGELVGVLGVVHGRDWTDRLLGREELTVERPEGTIETILAPDAVGELGRETAVAHERNEGLESLAENTVEKAYRHGVPRLLMPLAYRFRGDSPFTGVPLNC